jgi:hypothetical protein
LALRAQGNSPGLDFVPESWNKNPPGLDFVPESWNKNPRDQPKLGEFARECGSSANECATGGKDIYAL